MGKLFSHWEIKGPGEIAPKRIAMLKSCFRYASRNNLEFNPPESHPFNPLYVLRLATKACSGDKQKEVIDALWELIWKEGKVADEPELIAKHLNSKGLEGEKLIEKSFSREAKLELKQNTKEAIAKHVFGVPTFITGKENFWGNDSLTDLINHLEGKDNWNRELFLKRTEDVKI